MARWSDPPGHFSWVFTELRSEDADVAARLSRGRGNIGRKSVARIKAMGEMPPRPSLETARPRAGAGIGDPRQSQRPRCSTGVAGFLHQVPRGLTLAVSRVGEVASPPSPPRRSAKN